MQISNSNHINIQVFFLKMRQQQKQTMQYERMTDKKNPHIIM